MRPHAVPQIPDRPLLHAAFGESLRLFALFTSYTLLLGLFALAALGIWTQMPSAIADSQLIPISASSPHSGTLKLRGAL